MDETSCLEGQSIDEALTLEARGSQYLIMLNHHSQPTATIVSCSLQPGKLPEHGRRFLHVEKELNSVGLSLSHFPPRLGLQMHAATSGFYVIFSVPHEYSKDLTG